MPDLIVDLGDAVVGERPPIDLDIVNVVVGQGQVLCFGRGQPSDASAVVGAPRGPVATRAARWPIHDAVAAMSTVTRTAAHAAVPAGLDNVSQIQAHFFEIRTSAPLRVDGAAWLVAED
eukprot:9499382-Pyramimonas_sp.AAC.1